MRYGTYSSDGLLPKGASCRFSSNGELLVSGDYGIWTTRRCPGWTQNSQSFDQEGKYFIDKSQGI